MPLLVILQYCHNFCPPSIFVSHTCFVSSMSHHLHQSPSLTHMIILIQAPRLHTLFSHDLHNLALGLVRDDTVHHPTFTFPRWFPSLGFYRMPQPMSSPKAKRAAHSSSDKVMKMIEVLAWILLHTIQDDSSRWILQPTHQSIRAKVVYLQVLLILQKERNSWT